MFLLYLTTINEEGVSIKTLEVVNDFKQFKKSIKEYALEWYEENNVNQDGSKIVYINTLEENKPAHDFPMLKYEITMDLNTTAVLNDSNFILSDGAKSVLSSDKQVYFYQNANMYGIVNESSKYAPHILSK